MIQNYNLESKKKSSDGALTVPVMWDTLYPPIWSKELKKSPISTRESILLFNKTDLLQKKDEQT